MRAVVALIAIVGFGCSRDSSAAASGGTKVVAALKGGHSEHSFVMGADSYAARAVGAAGSVAGTITLQRAAPVDSVQVTSGQPVCRTDVAGAVEAGAKGTLSNAIVWIADVKTGKALPMEKRVVLSSEDCTIDPRVQATVVGATINVFNDDKLFHRLVFIRPGTTDTLAVMPFFNIGSVVPTEKLTKTDGVVEVRCALHPWTRGYLAVFNHPYFAVTDKDGRFKLDSLPPGTYKLMVWHEGLQKPIERSITIQPGSAGKVDVAMTLGAL